MASNNKEELVRINEGETHEDAVQRWWRDNGLDAEAAMKKRKETYHQQLIEAAKAMDRFKNANAVTNKD